MCEAGPPAQLRSLLMGRGAVEVPAPPMAGHQAAVKGGGPLRPRVSVRSFPTMQEGGGHDEGNEQ